MPRHALRLLLAPALACLLGAATPHDEYRLAAPDLPRPFLDPDGAVNLAIEASGVQPIGHGLAVVAHDKESPLFVVDLATGDLVGDRLTAPGFPGTTDAGPKWEGMATDGDGNLYVIGSHSGGADERAQRSEVVRFRLTPGTDPAIAEGSIARYTIRRALVDALKAAGLDDEAIDDRKIEGLAIREADGRKELVVGLRQPDDRVRAFAADLTSASDGDELLLRPVFAFEAAPREGVASQLTALEYAPTLGGFLVVTATEDDDNAFHGNTLWFVADDRPEGTEPLGAFEVAMKAEGLAVLDGRPDAGGAALRLLVTFDNDAHTTRIPSRYQRYTLRRVGHGHDAD